ncbi:MAG TPA: SAM-dependent methyltransferase, partial [Pilimelia sp.]|nr:SAM-dependent methyltransferase [Pilimelia sp.]
VFDPAAYRPPWDFVAGLPARVPRTVLKLAPGIDHALLPPGAEGEWVSVDGDLVEATAWCGPLAGAPRRATLLRGTGDAALTGTGDRTAPVGRPGGAAPDDGLGGRAGDRAARPGRGGGRRAAPQAPVTPGCVLYDPDPAVVRAHLVAEFAETVGGWLGDPRVAYVYAADHTPTPYARAVAVTDVLPFSLKRLRALLRARGVGRLEIMKRSSPLDPHTLRRQLGPAGPHAATLVLTRVGDAPLAMLGQPVPAAR